MQKLSFRAYLQVQEKFLPPFAVPTTGINPLPVTQARLKLNDHEARAGTEPVCTYGPEGRRGRARQVRAEGQGV